MKESKDEPEMTETKRAPTLADFKIYYLGGRCADGAERDSGTLYHLVDKSGKALCGKRPGRRSAGWFEAYILPQPVTCAACLRRANKTFVTEPATREPEQMKEEKDGPAMTDAERQELNLDAKHFEMLRIAKLRGLRVRRIGESVYAVTSHTHEADGLEWVVTFPMPDSPLQSITCSCPAKHLPYCSHRAAAVNHYFTVNAGTAGYDAYTKANSNDRLQLRLRIRAGELSKSDKTYVRYAMKRYEQTRAAVVPASSIRKVESVTPTGKKVVREYARGIQI
jgi:hypothetical protein